MNQTADLQAPWHNKNEFCVTVAHCRCWIRVSGYERNPGYSQVNKCAKQFLLSYRNVNITDDGDGEDETSGEVTVGVCINQNDFGLKLLMMGIGEEEDVTNLVK